MDECQLRYGDVNITLRNERCYTLGSADNLRRYDKEYKLDDDLFTSFHGVECQQADGKRFNCLVAGSGGPTRIHIHSCVAQGDSLILAVGDSLCRLSIPTLEMLWHKKIDHATCFEVYWSAKHECLVIHGELDITRVSMDGQIEWQVSGKDIFSEGFELLDDKVLTEDWEHNHYDIDLATGRCKLIQ